MSVRILDTRCVPARPLPIAASGLVQQRDRGLCQCAFWSILSFVSMRRRSFSFWESHVCPGKVATSPVPAERLPVIPQAGACDRDELRGRASWYVFHHMPAAFREDSEPSLRARQVASWSVPALVWHRRVRAGVRKNHIGLRQIARGSCAGKRGSFQDHGGSRAGPGAGGQHAADSLGGVAGRRRAYGGDCGDQPQARGAFSARVLADASRELEDPHFSHGWSAGAAVAACRGLCGAVGRAHLRRPTAD
mmetsp:Transcript_52181/g.138182  ORF Transcript_52181/g.138182 Transcript_52181/m.138182 type:complete len:249 (-) Transcript_52181:2496-3242(-)